MQLQLVTTAEHEEESHSEREEGLVHGTVVMDRLLRLWLGAGKRIVCADSYFASYEETAHLRLRGLRFISVVKTSTRMFPMRLLRAKPIANRGAGCRPHMRTKTVTWWRWPWSGSTASGGTLSGPLPALLQAPRMNALAGTRLRPAQHVLRSRSSSRSALRSTILPVHALISTAAVDRTT